MDEMLLVYTLRRGSARVLMSCDLRFGRVQESPEAALSAAQRQRLSLPLGNLMQSLQSKCST
jgi:ketopantoate hydroxymethyltransferase